MLATNVCLNSNNIIMCCVNRLVFCGTSLSELSIAIIIIQEAILPIKDNLSIKENT